MALKTASEAQDVGETKICEKGTFVNTHVLSKLLAQMYTDVHTAHAYSGYCMKCMHGYYMHLTQIPHALTKKFVYSIFLSHTAPRPPILIVS